jgi:regulator of protease activity HflC (stomatin/prohibitin superfamily)
MPTNEAEVKNFVYRLGAGRFDELLNAEIDENIRTFINGIWLSQVFDLKGDMARNMINELNHKFQAFGVIFENCNVTNVHVSEQLNRALEEKAKIKYSLANHIKEYEN